LGRIVTALIVVILLTSGIVFTVFSPNPAYGLTIPVGEGPVYVDIDRTTNTIYVVNQVSNDVTVIDGNTNTVITTIPVGISPSGAVFVEPVNSLYVLNQNSGDISVIDVATNTVVNTIPIGFALFGHEFNPNTNKLYVGNISTNSIIVIDVTTNTVVGAHIPVQSFPTSMTVNTVTNLMYIGNFLSSSISVFDTLTNTVVDTIFIPGGVSLVGIDENTNTIYIPAAFLDQIVVMDGSTNTIIDSITVGDSPRRAIFNDATNEIYAQSFNSNIVSIIDATTNTVTANIPVDTPFSINFNSVTKILYATNQALDTLTVIDLLANNPPLANAGPDQLVLEEETVELDGTGSSDADEDALDFNWIQTLGTPVTLSDSSSSNPTFIAPLVAGSEALTFELIVSDGTFQSVPDSVDITVTKVTNFEVPLSQTGVGSLSGDVVIGDLSADVPITLDFNIPEGILNLGELNKSFLTPSSDEIGVSFSFELSSTTPGNLPDLPVDSGLFFDINFAGADFSDPSNFSPNELPRIQFTIPVAVNADNTFPDGCPITPIFLFDENTNQWEQLGDPQEPNTNRVYVANNIDNTVSVVDIATNEVIQVIPVGQGSGAVEFNPNTNRLYVSNGGSNNLSVIDTTTNSVIDTIIVGNGPSGMAIDTDANLIYVVKDAGDVQVIDGLTNTVIDTIILPGVSLISITLDFNNQKGFVTDFFTKTISVIDLTTNTVVDTIDAEDGPARIVINPDTDTAYATMFLDGVVLVIDTQTNGIIKTIQVESGPLGAVFNPNNNKVYVINALSNTVSVIDAVTNTLIGSIPVGNAPFWMDLVQLTNRIYVTNFDSETISVIDANTDTVIGTIDAGANPRGITANPNVSNPVRDPSTDIIENGSIIECSNIAGLPHLSKFSVGGIKALFLAGGVSSHGGSAPSLNSISYDGVTTTNDDGTIEFGGVLIDKILPINNLPTQTVATGELFKLRLPFYEDSGFGSLHHVGVYFLQGDEKTIDESQTSVGRLFIGKILSIITPPNPLSPPAFVVP